MPRTATVVTVSTGIAKGERQDASGGILRDGLAALGLEVADGGVIPDQRLVIQQTILRLADFDRRALIVFTGGTGPTPDDVTTQAILPLLDRRYHGIENALFDDARGSTPRAPMTRLLAGARHGSVIIALPGSPGACRDALRTLSGFLSHLLTLSAGMVDPH